MNRTHCASCDNPFWECECSGNRQLCDAAPGYTPPCDPPLLAPVVTPSPVESHLRERIARLRASMQRIAKSGHAFCQHGECQACWADVALQGDDREAERG